MVQAVPGTFKGNSYLWLVLWDPDVYWSKKQVEDSAGVVAQALVAGAGSALEAGRDGGRQSQAECGVGAV